MSVNLLEHKALSAGWNRHGRQSMSIRAGEAFLLRLINPVIGRGLVTRTGAKEAGCGGDADQT